MLKTKIGNQSLDVCIFNASGVYCKTETHLQNLNDCVMTGAILTKSCTLNYREGNSHPIYWDDGNSMSINSSGLPNMGYKYYIDLANYKDYDKPYIISISGLCLEDNIKRITEVLNNSSIQAFELNLSCPNVIGKPQIGYDFEGMDNLLNKIDYIVKNSSRKINFGIKLPPYFDMTHFTTVSKIINKYNINTITCINSLGNGLVVNPSNESVVIKPKGGLGGIGGSVIKAIALSNVRQFSKMTQCDVIGCGGIKTGRDAFEHILCGAKAVQIGTQFYIEGLDVFERVSNELIHEMKKYGYTSIEDFCGKLKEI